MTTVRYPLVLRAFRIKYLAVTRGSDEADQPRPGQLSERGDLARSRMLSCSRTPYLLYELDRMSNDHVPVTVVDRGAFPDDVVRSAHPLPAKSAIDDPVDPCRVRALIDDRLEAAADRGDTLRPLDRVIQDVRELECTVDTAVASPGCRWLGRSSAGPAGRGVNSTHRTA